ncbi:MAG: hypothetical protein D6725_05810 [Planctomycetota bacterium]|nr:MAG: hypothetical protein D6725_05810 [Planctomycetota bacterium]
MHQRSNPLFASFPIGVYAGTNVRVSVFFPLLLLVLWYRLGDWRVALAFCGVLFLSVLAHEFGHVFAARRTGGDGREILIWPLGGLAFVQPAPTFWSRFWTAACGPAVNLCLCLVTLPAVLWTAANPTDVLHPFVFPNVPLTSETFWRDVVALIFVANEILLLVNLLPVFPLDGGRMLQCVLAEYRGRQSGNEVYLRVGFTAGFLALFAGLVFSNTWIMFIGAVVLVLNVQEAFQLQFQDQYEEGFLGYDFSQGYTSLERGEEGERVAVRRPGPIRRWLARRRAAREEKRIAEELALRAEVDALLAKVHEFGYDSLSESEKRRLQQASRLFRRNRIGE